MSINPVQFAFPGPKSNGITLRDYLAAQALSGMLANQSTLINDSDVIRAIAGVSYDLADAMLEARQKRGAE